MRLIDDKKNIKEYIISEAYIITDYLMDYLKDKKRFIEDLERTLSIQEAFKFDPAVALSQNRILLMGNILQTLQVRDPNDLTDTFYQAPQNTIPCLVPYFNMVLFETLKTTTLQEVKEAIISSQGKSSLFLVIHDKSLVINDRVLKGTQSLTLKFNGQDIVVGKGGMSIVDYFKNYKKGNNKEIRSIENDPESFGRKLYNRNKTTTAEHIGISYAMRDLRISGAEYHEGAIVPHPLGVKNFPDFVIDLRKVLPKTKKFIDGIIGKSDQTTLIVDTKATLDLNSNINSGNARLQYPTIGQVTNFLVNQGIIGVPEEMFNDLPPESYVPKKLSREDFSKIVHIYASLGEKDTSHSSYEGINQYLSDTEMVIIYQEVGSRTNSQPTYYLVNYFQYDYFVMYKVSKSRYVIHPNNDMNLSIANIGFYNSSHHLKILSPEARMEYDRFKKKKDAVNPIEDENEEVDSSLSQIVMADLPLESLHFMFRWGKDTLQPLVIPKYVPQLPKEKQEEAITYGKDKVPETNDVATNPNFLKWFDGSVVKTKDGRPKIVYHGTVMPTGEGFTQFERGHDDPGSHFGSVKAAHDILTTKFSASWNRASGQAMFPVYLKITKPLYIKDLGGWYPEAIIGALLQDPSLSEYLIEELEEMYKGLDKWETSPKAFIQLKDILRNYGYDGFIYKNTVEDVGSTSYCVFEPTQIKSAIGNSGNFNPNSPHVHEATINETVNFNFYSLFARKP